MSRHSPVQGRARVTADYTGPYTGDQVRRRGAMCREGAFLRGELDPASL